MSENGSSHPAAPAAALVLRAAAMSPYEPSSYEQALAMAATFAESGLCKVQKAAAAYMVMATGQSLGIPPETALRTFHVIDGVVTLPAQIMVALCLRRRDVCEYFDCIESDAAHAVFETKRAGRPPQRISYTLEQAQRAGLVRQGGNWQKDPEAMCCARASSRLVRRVYPDIVAGLYTADEIMDGEAPIEPRGAAPLAPLGSGATSAPPSTAAAAPQAAASAPDLAAEAAREGEFAAALRAARDDAAGLAIGEQIKAAWPEKDAAPRKRLLAVFKECKKAGWVKPAGEPPHDPATGEIREREPGQDDA